MIRYKRLVVDNYKSISHAAVSFVPGIFSVIGETIQGEYSSNGSGKSSILQALTLGLYNKDFQGAPLDTVSNRYTGEPFKIQVELDVVKNGVSATYLIVNDRGSKKITVRKNGKVLCATTNKSLKIIQDLLGMSEATFKFTHYITTNSILELTSNLSNATLFNEVLKVTELKQMAKDMVDVAKEYHKELGTLKEHFNELKNIHKLLQVTDKYNIPDLMEQEDSLKSELNALSDLFEEHVQPLQSTLEILRTTVLEKRVDLKQQERTLKDGTCTLCGTDLLTSSKMQNIESAIYNLTLEIDDTDKEREEVNSRYQELLLTYNISKSELETKLKEVQYELTIGSQIQEIHKETLDTDIYSKKEYHEVQQKINHLYSLIRHIEDIKDAIRSGRIYEEVMNEFFKLVNMNIQKYKEVINFKAYDVEASSYKSGMVALLKHNGIEIPVESLSNGEKSRLSLLLLSALLESMSQITNSESNFLAIDEATSSFDKSGIEELSALFDHLKVLDQSVFIITHGSELQNVNFDGQVKVIKENNVSLVEVNYDHTV